MGKKSIWIRKPNKKNTANDERSIAPEENSRMWHYTGEVLVTLIICIFMGALLVKNDIPAWPALAIFAIDQACAVLCQKLAHYKGYNDAAALWVGALFNMIAVIYYSGLPYSPEYVDYALKRIENAMQKTCPQMAEPSAPAADYDASSPFIINPDPMLRTALEITFKYDDGYVSVRELMHKLKIDESRARGLIEEMEHRGIIEDEDGPQPRKIIIRRDELDYYCN